MFLVFADVPGVTESADAAASLFEDRALVGVIICLFAILGLLGWFVLKFISKKTEETTKQAEVFDKRLEVIHADHKQERDEWRAASSKQEQKTELLLQETIRHLKEK